MTTTDVLVVGAGPTGLIMANILARSGIHVRILDKRSGPTTETRAVVVHAKILELLSKIGLTDQMLREAERLAAMQLLRNGKRAGTLSFRNGTGHKATPYPFGLIYGQDQTEQLLLRSLVDNGGQVEWNTELLHIEEKDTEVHAAVRNAKGQEETIQARWVVAADGSHSPIRHALAFNFIGQSYAQTLFVADLVMDWELGPQQGGMELAWSGFYLFVPMSGTGQFRLFGTLPPEMAKRETITLDEVRHVLEVQGNLRVNILRANWISIYHTHQRMTEHFRRGRIFLAGDAAHIHSPAGGQGMNTGIGDAYNLAWKLALVVKGLADEKLLDSYEPERIPFARAILNGSDWAFQFQAATSTITRCLKFYVIPPIFRVISPLPLFQRRIFWLISQLWTSYRDSPIVAGKSRKGPQPGDRVPYGLFEGGVQVGESIFTLLKGMDHHLLLFAGDQPVSATSELEARLGALLQTYKLPIHLHTLSREHARLHKLYGADELTLFLVRPDGHLAYRGNGADLDSLRSYLDTWFTRQAPAFVQDHSSVGL